MLALPPSFPDELNLLQRLLPFPEEVALKLTETEYELFNSVPPIDYLRHCTTDLTARHHPSSQTANAQQSENGVPSLIRRFNEVSKHISNCLAYFFNGRHVGRPTQVESVSLAHYTSRLVGPES